jgi:hypothetical protein
MNKLVSIDVLSEGEEGEYAVIPLNLIHYLEMKIESESVRLFPDSGNVDKVSMTSFLAISFNKDVLAIETSQKKMFFDQLLRRDISQIYLNYDNGESEVYYCNWCEDSWKKNLYQTNNFENEGLVEILISNHNHNTEKENKNVDKR